MLNRFRVPILMLALVAGLALAACDGGSSTSPCTALEAAAGRCSPQGTPTPTPAPALCPLQTFPAPIAGFAGLYSITVEPPGPYELTVNGTSRAVEAGTFVTAVSGDLVQACRSCGCSPAVVLR